MAVQRKYRFNLNNYSNMPEVVVSQYDKEYELIFYLYDGNSPANLEDITATLRGTRSDKLKYSFDGTIAGNVLAFEIDTTMTGCAGSGVAELLLTDTNGLNYGTYNFTVTVEESPVPDGAVDADVERAEEIAEQVQDIVDTAAQTVTEAGEAWAAGTKGGEAVPSTDPAYHNNAKYYMQQAQGIADSIGIDDTLSVAGKAADAKEAGDQIREVITQINDLEDTVEAIELDLSIETKKALLACFENVAWKNINGKRYYDALEAALNISTIIRGNQLGNYSLWQTVFPYYSSSDTRIVYKDLDVLVTGGHIYQITVRAAQSGLQMYINVYNKHVLDQYAEGGNISAGDHLDILGGWTTAFEQSIVIPKVINNSPAAGLVFGFKNNDDSNINSDAIDTISIKALDYGVLPIDYTAYDYIKVVDSESQVSTDSTGLIGTHIYDNLSLVSISADISPLTTIGTENLPILGVRTDNQWEHVTAIYLIEQGARFSVHDRGANSFVNTISLGTVGHIDLRPQGELPNVFISQGTRYTGGALAHNNSVNAPLYIFSLPIYDANYSSRNYNLSRNVQLGAFTVIDTDGTIDVYVPAVRNSDNVIGIFNLTKQQFHTCQNALKATIGNSACIYQVGNWI